MKNTIIRSLSGLAFVVIVSGAIYAGPLFFFSVFSIFLALALSEFYHLLGVLRNSIIHYTGIAAGLSGFLGYHFHHNPLLPSSLFLSGLILFILMIYLVNLYQQKKPTFTQITVLFSGLIYAALPFALLNDFAYPLCKSTYTPHLLMGFFVLQWTSDTGAYIAGMTMGKHKMIPRISPKKSWEGFAGGIVLSLIVGWLIAAPFGILNHYQWIILAGIISITGVFGDLLESSLKRSLDIKDSGHFLPGHGGVLDRFDSIFISVPAAFIYIHLIL